MRINECIVCGKSYEAQKKSKIYCSEKCRRNKRRGGKAFYEVERVCVRCGTRFYPKAANRKYCTDKCNQANHRENRKHKYEWNSWRGMVERCNYKKNKKYADYGGRGITVCERWRKFKNFLEDMGEKPTPKHEIDRIDNEGDYCPENCKWSTRTENMRNTRSNKMNPAKVIFARFMYRVGALNQPQLAEMFSSTQVNMSAVVNGKVWKDLPV